MDRITLWHVHDRYGTCYAMAANYDVAIQLCISFYGTCGKTKSFFATQTEYAQLNKKPLPNS